MNCLVMGFNDSFVGPLACKYICCLYAFLIFKKNFLAFRLSFSYSSMSDEVFFFIYLIPCRFLRSFRIHYFIFYF